MRRHLAEIHDLDAQVLAISLEPAERLRLLVQQLQLPFPVLSDVHMGAYRAYQLRRGSIAQVLSLGTIWCYLKLITRGRPYQFRRSDMRQLGGHFVIDAAGIVQYEHPSTTANDRPSMEELSVVLRRM